MVEIGSNDNSKSAVTAPDPHGQAAILLVESLIHHLIASSIMSVADAVEVVKIAADVKAEIAEDVGDTAATKVKSLAILGAIKDSFSVDLPRK